MGIFDTKALRIRANELFVLAREEHQKGQIGFAEQLRAQARRYLKELAAMDNRSDVGGFKGKNSQLD
jgi:hypothetical protein